MKCQRRVVKNYKNAPRLLKCLEKLIVLNQEKRENGWKNNKKTRKILEMPLRAKKCSKNQKKIIKKFPKRVSSLEICW